MKKGVIINIEKVEYYGNIMENNFLGGEENTIK